MRIELEHLGESFSHRELCMFARAAIRHRAGLSVSESAADWGHGFRQALRDAERELDRLNIEFSRLKPWRAPNIFANGFARLHPSEITFLVLSLKHCWLVGLSIDQVAEMDRAAKARAARKARAEHRPPSENGALDPRNFAEFLHLPLSGEHQSILRQYVGDYLIFRGLRTTLRLSVSHMRIAQDRGDAYPATYVTTTLVSGADSKRLDAVQGLLHVAPGASGVIFATGRHEGTGQIRLTILEPRSKPAYDTEEMPSDLVGLRLSLSEGHPEGYHVWCSRIATEPQPTAEKLHAVAQEYDLVRMETPTEKVMRLMDDPGFNRQHDCQPQQWFEKHVVGFKEILAYLDDKPIVTMD